MNRFSGLLVLFSTLWIGQSVLAAQPANQNALSDPKTLNMLAKILQNNPNLASKLQETLAEHGISDNEQGKEKKNDNDATDAKAQAAKIAQQAADNQYHVKTSAELAEEQLKTVRQQQDSDEKAYQELNEPAFKAILHNAFPLSPGQIQMLHNKLDETQRVQAAAPNNSPPRPTSSSILVKLDTGSTPPVIRLSRGFVSSLVFIDTSGSPWPIEAYDIGNPDVFDIKWNKQDNTLLIQARAGYTYGNLAVILKDLNTPVMLTLVPGQSIVDYRVDLQIQGLGPLSKPGIQGVGLPSQPTSSLLSVLDGVPPKSSKELEVEGNMAQAWVLKNRIFVRTRHTLLSPAWVSKMSSADGMNAYEVQKTPMLLLSRHGKAVQVKVEGF